MWRRKYGGPQCRESNRGLGVGHIDIRCGDGQNNRYPR